MTGTMPHATTLPERTWNRQVLALVGPIVLANLSVPLPGIVDTAVMGHLPETSGLAAVGLGAVIFSTLYAALGFLRMSTVGLTAQAEGARDIREVKALIGRSGAVAIVLAALLLLFQGPIGTGAFSLVDVEDSVRSQGLVYFDIRIWGAPAALLNFAIMGWLFGLGDMRWPVALQIVTNLLNVALDLVFVFGFGWGIEGIAAATVLAEWAGLAIGSVIVLNRLSAMGGKPLSRTALTDPSGIRKLLGVNRDIFIRTLVLLVAFGHFKVVSANFGTEALAANIVLLIFLDLSAYGLDAFANAAEILVGKAVGSRNAAMFRGVVRAANLQAGLTAVVSCATFFLVGDAIVGLITDQDAVRQASQGFIWLAAITPVTAFWAFVMDGVFIGATRSAALRNGMIAALACYMLAQWLLVDAYGNTGLWVALNLFLLVRGIVLGVQYEALARSVAPKRASASA